MSRYRLEIVRHKNSADLGGDREDVRSVTRERTVHMA